MIWHNHSELKGKHALFSPSQPSWLRYGDAKIQDTLISSYAATVGTLLHEFAAKHIRYGIRLTKSGRQDKEASLYLMDNSVPVAAFDMNYLWPNLVNYVNDAIGYRMQPEVALWYSDYCFGHADSISFRDRLLRVHDLKTGLGHVKMEQLTVYAALFCLEYKVKPEDIGVELRIYQGGEILYDNPVPDELRSVMNAIQSADKIARQIAGMEDLK